LQIQFVFVCLGLSPLVDECFAALAIIYFFQNNKPKINKFGNYLPESTATKAGPSEAQYSTKLFLMVAAVKTGNFGFSPIPNFPTYAENWLTGFR
jgi:hypothetical protein